MVLAITMWYSYNSITYYNMLWSAWKILSKKQKTPNDWCYIYNFDNPNEPIAVSLPAGQGKEFKNAMDGFILKQLQAVIKSLTIY